MKNILKEFANGNLSMTGSIKKNSEYERTLKELCEYENKLKATMDGDIKEIFEKFMEFQAKADFISEIDRFIYGYRLGALMMIEVFRGNPDAIYGDELNRNNEKE